MRKTRTGEWTLCKRSQLNDVLKTESSGLCNEASSQLKLSQGNTVRGSQLSPSYSEKTDCGSFWSAEM